MVAVKKRPYFPGSRDARNRVGMVQRRFEVQPIGSVARYRWLGLNLARLDAE